MAQGSHGTPDISSPQTDTIAKKPAFPSDKGGDLGSANERIAYGGKNSGTTIDSPANPPLGQGGKT